MARTDAREVVAAAGPSEPVGVREQMASLQRPGAMPAAVSTPRNILSNLVGNITGAAIGFVLAPIMIHGLGDLQYGMWALALSLLGSYGLIDTGLRIAMQRYVAQFKGTNQRESLNQVLATVMLLMVAASVAVCALTGILVVFLPNFFHVGASSQSLFRWALGLLGLSIAFIFPTRALNTYLLGLQRFDLSNSGFIGTTIIRAVLIIAVLRLGFGLLGVAGVTLTVEALSLPLYSYLVRRADPEVSFDSRNAQFARMRELAGFSFYAYLCNAGDYLRFSTDSAVISRFLGVVLVTPFSVAGRLMDNFRSLIAVFSSPLMPRMSELDGQGRTAELEDFFVRSTKMTSLVSLFIGALVLLDGKSLLRLWLGERFVSSFDLLLVLTAGYVLALAQAPSVSLMFARGRHRLLGCWTLGEGAANLLLSIFWARRFGLLGVALGTTVPMLVTGLFIQPLYVVHLLNLSLGRYIRRAFAGPMFACVLFLLFSKLVFAGQTQTRIPLFAFVLGCQSILFVLIVYATALNNGERQLAYQRCRQVATRFGRLMTSKRPSI
jgi:O-antigen/teichoic acid export membrane protein